MIAWCVRHRHSIAVAYKYNSTCFVFSFSCSLARFLLLLGWLPSAPIKLCRCVHVDDVTATLSSDVPYDWLACCHANTMSAALCCDVVYYLISWPTALDDRGNQNNGPGWICPSLVWPNRWLICPSNFKYLLCPFWNVLGFKIDAFPPCQYHFVILWLNSGHLKMSLLSTDIKSNVCRS